jgi:type IV pilus assembly protein PilA
MKTSAPSTYIKGSKGFSLVELSIVVVILGVLAIYAVPKFLQSVERTKAATGFTFLTDLGKKQELFWQQKGRYAYSQMELQAELSAVLIHPDAFKVSGYASGDWETRWGVKLTRDGASSGFGRYTIVWNQDGWDSNGSSIPSELQPAR